MDKTLTEKPKVQSAATVKAKVRRIKAAKPEVEVAAKPVKSQVNAHVAAGINVALYDGPSSFVNGNRTTKVMLGREVSPAKVTTRAQKGLYALRGSYKDGAFNPRGFDNGILRDLLGAGLVARIGTSGQEQTIDGKRYLVDGDRPVGMKLTPAGMSYGKA